MGDIGKTYRKIKVSVVREACVPYARRQKVACGVDAASLIVSLIGNAIREHFIAVYLDGRHRIIGSHVVSVGTANMSGIHPREVFLPAVHLSATAIILAHNHPSGDPAPSVDDMRTTDRLKEAGKMLGIEVLDHIILGDDEFFAHAEGITFPLGDLP